LECDGVVDPLELALGAEVLETGALRPTGAEPAGGTAYVGNGELGLGREQPGALSDHVVAVQAGAEQGACKRSGNQPRAALRVEVGAERRIEGDLLAAEGERAHGTDDAVWLGADVGRQLVEHQGGTIGQLEPDRAVAHGERVELQLLKRGDERRQASGHRPGRDRGLAIREVGREGGVIQRHSRAIAGDEHGDHLAAARKPGAAGRHGKGPAFEGDHGGFEEADRRAEAVAVARGGKYRSALEAEICMAAAHEIRSSEEEDEAAEDRDRQQRASQRLPRAFHGPCRFSARRPLPIRRYELPVLAGRLSLVPLRTLTVLKVAEMVRKRPLLGGRREATSLRRRSLYTA
jgi:hypothetical protein